MNDRTMHVFLESERLVLRRLTEADAGALVELDSDPQVMRFSGPDDAIRPEDLPTLLSYYDRYAGYGFWAAIEKSSGEFVGWFHFRPQEGAGPEEVSWATGCATRLGAGATPPKARSR